MSKRAAQRWLALESNPESMNAWSHSLGLDTKAWAFQDCWGLDDDSLSWVAQPVKAVLLLFPVDESYSAKKKADAVKIEEEGVENVGQMIFIEQRIRNACGTFALLHSLGNAGVPLEEGFLTDFFKKCVGLTPAERADLLDTESGELEAVHSEVAQTGQTATPALEAEVDLHFVAFVPSRDGKDLIELDGSRTSPVNHGPIGEDGLLKATAKVVRKVMDESDGNLNFSIITLGPAPKEED